MSPVVNPGGSSSSTSGGFTPTATKTSAYGAAVGDWVIGDTSAGGFTVTLPAAPANGSAIMVENIGSANTLTVAAGAGDTISATINTQGLTTRRALEYIYRSSDKVWYGATPLNSAVTQVTVDSTTIVNTGSATSPSLHTGTLDVIAANQAPVAAVAMNAQKITGLANGSANGDAAAFNQVQDLLAVALGYKAWNFPAAVAGSGSAPTQGTIYAEGIYIPPGIVITGIVLTTATPAAGTKPTAFFVGLAAPTKMVQQSADISGAGGAPWNTNGQTQAAFTSTYTTSTSDSANGLYYVIFMQVGAYGTTQPAFARNSGNSSAALAGQSFPYGVAGTAQTVLPGNGSAITITTNNLGYQVGVY